MMDSSLCVLLSAGTVHLKQNNEPNIPVSN